MIEEITKLDIKDTKHYINITRIKITNVIKIGKHGKKILKLTNF